MSKGGGSNRGEWLNVYDRSAVGKRSNASLTKLDAKTSLNGRFFDGIFDFGDRTREGANR